MKSKNVGLTLGKFAPLHKGHQYLIETALSEVDHLIIVIYNCPETTSISLNIRADWIRKLYPQVEVIEAWDGPLEMGNTPEIKKKQEDYILGILKGRKVTSFYSSEFYVEHMSLALKAVDRRIDERRQNIPISGTEIRKDPYRRRKFIHPIVYRNFITNVVFLGAPSTGKTTIAQKMAEEFKTVWMPEYGREYWDKNQVNRRLTMDQLVEIAQQHLEREEKLLFDANKFLFADTNALTTFMFSLYYHNKAHEKLIQMANQAVSRYDVVFLCDIDIPYDDTWDRSGDVNRKEFQRQIIEDLNSRKISFIVLKGNLNERVNQVKEVLKNQ